MGTNFVERCRKGIARRWSMCSSPDSYALKNNIYEYQREIYRRSHLALQDVNAISESISGEWLNACALDSQEALYYGALHSLLDYANISYFTMPPNNLGIQHGYVFEICEWEKAKLEKRNLVWSKKMVDMYRKLTSNKDIYAIGAPFFYAKSLLDDEQLRIERKRLGNNLLAFPMHSQIHVDTNYNPEKFLNVLIEEREHYDTVRVCMYWKDIIRGAHKVYEDAGFECVCNGHLYDPNFLRRQKALFELADATISNGVGSHIGYSIFMGKPHKLIDDEYEYININKSGDAKDLTEVSKKNNFLRVKKAFVDNHGYSITKQQQEIVDEFWGISDIKSQKEIRELLLYLYDI